MITRGSIRNENAVSRLFFHRKQQNKNKYFCLVDAIIIIFSEWNCFRFLSDRQRGTAKEKKRKTKRQRFIGTKWVKMKHEKLSLHLFFTTEILFVCYNLWWKFLFSFFFQFFVSTFVREHAVPDRQKKKCFLRSMYRCRCNDETASKQFILCVRRNVIDIVNIRASLRLFEAIHSLLVDRCWCVHCTVVHVCVFVCSCLRGWNESDSIFDVKLNSSLARKLLLFVSMQIIRLRITWHLLLFRSHFFFFFISPEAIPSNHNFIKHIKIMWKAKATDDEEEKNCRWIYFFFPYFRACELLLRKKIHVFNVRWGKRTRDVMNLSLILDKHSSDKLYLSRLPPVETFASADNFTIQSMSVAAALATTTASRCHLCVHTFAHNLMINCRRYWFYNFHFSID